MYPIDNLFNFKWVYYQIEIYRNEWYLNTGIFYVDQETSIFCKVDLSSLDPEERLSSLKMGSADKNLDQDRRDELCIN